MPPGDLDLKRRRARVTVKGGTVKWVLSGTVSYGVWGWIWFAPLLLVDSKLKQARRLARQRVIAAMEARHAAAATHREP